MKTLMQRRRTIDVLTATVGAVVVLWMLLAVVARVLGQVGWAPSWALGCVLVAPFCLIAPMGLGRPGDVLATLAYVLLVVPYTVPRPRTFDVAPEHCSPTIEACFVATCSVGLLLSVIRMMRRKREGDGASAGG